MAKCTCRPVPALWPTPIPPPNSRNASTRRRHCSARLRRPGASRAVRHEDSNKSEVFGPISYKIRDRLPPKHQKPYNSGAMIILIDNYDSFTFNLVHYFGGLGAQVAVHRNDKISVKDVIAAEPEAIVLSPGPCTPNEAGICLDLIEQASPIIPMFGVCLGLQSIGQAFGGKVVRAPAPFHGKLSDIQHEGRGVFRGINGLFKATRYHSLVVEASSL